MNALEKLKHLLEHWIEHNEEHAGTYLDWANKMETSGNHELAAVLKKITEETKKTEVLFRKAKALLDSGCN